MMSMATNNMYYFPTYICVGSGGNESAATDGHSYHAYTYMIAFTCFFTNNIVLFSHLYS